MELFDLLPCFRVPFQKTPLLIQVSRVLPCLFQQIHNSPLLQKQHKLFPGVCSIHYIKCSGQSQKRCLHFRHSVCIKDTCPSSTCGTRTSTPRAIFYTSSSTTLAPYELPRSHPISNRSVVPCLPTFSWGLPTVSLFIIPFFFFLESKKPLQCELASQI